MAGAEEVLQCLVGTLHARPVAGLSGVISVKTESWNSRDGVVQRSHKSQSIGGRNSGNKWARSGHNHPKTLTLTPVLIILTLVILT